MRIRILPSIARLMLVGGTGVAAAQDVLITPEEDVVIREYIVRERIEPVPPPPDFEVIEGATLPEAVEIRPLNVPEIETPYEYVVIDGHTVLVDPGTRRVVHIID